MDKVFPTSQILINSNNYDKASNSFIYNFNSDQLLNNHVIGMQQCIIYNQFYNISSALGNNKIRVDFPSGRRFSSELASHERKTQLTTATRDVSCL